MNGAFVVHLLFEGGAPVMHRERRFSRGHHTPDPFRYRVKFLKVLVGHDSGHGTAEENSERHGHAQQRRKLRVEAVLCYYIRRFRSHCCLYIARDLVEKKLLSVFRVADC